MKENPYDKDQFFTKYSQMSRSVDGLDGAGEWYELQKLLPSFQKKRVLDLGCGFGWHCRYAAEHGASSVVGVDISEKMLAVAKTKTHSPIIQYVQTSIEDFSYLPSSFDVVVSSLTFHYLESFERICEKVFHCLADKGTFVFSVEHPIFTAQGTQDWCYDAEGRKLHWPVDNYFDEGARTAVFLDEEIIKYHKTLTTYINGLLKTGFEITALVEPEPDTRLLHTVPGMTEELRRPMMLLVSAQKG